MRPQPKKYDNFIEDPNETVDARTLITMMRMMFTVTRNQQIGGAAYMKVHDMVNPTAHKGWVDYSQTGGARYQAFEIVDGNPDESQRVSAVYLMFLGEDGWWIARDA